MPIPVRHSRGPPFPGSAIPTVRLTLTLPLTLTLTLTLTLILTPMPGPWEWRTTGMADPGSGEPVPWWQQLWIFVEINLIFW